MMVMMMPVVVEDAKLLLHFTLLTPDSIGSREICKVLQLLCLTCQARKSTFKSIAIETRLLSISHLKSDVDGHASIQTLRQLLFFLFMAIHQSCVDGRRHLLR